MRLIDRYIAKTVLAAIGLVTLMLAGLQIFILFVNQLDDIGKADYGLLAAAVYVFLQMPYQVYLFFPMASLLGCLIGLGMMANYCELVVIRAAGMSIGQITVVVMKAALVLIVLVTVLGESLIPKMAYFAADYKMTKLSRGQAIRTSQGLWLRNENNFIAINRILPHQQLADIYQFQFDKSHYMKFARLIHSMSYVDGHWLAKDIDETRFEKNEKTSQRHVDSMVWEVAIDPKLLGISNTEPDEMTLKELYRYIKVQQAARVSVVSYHLALWQRLVQPFTTLVMMMLAIPFIFGPLRSSTMGSKFLMGAMVGFGFYIVNRFFGPVSMVYQWPPELAALGPTVIFSILGFYLMRRVR